MDNAVLALAADFPPATRADWRALVAGVLTRAGRSFDPAAPEAALTRTDYDGIAIAPLYIDRPGTDQPDGGVGEPGQAPFVRGAAAPGGLGWDVRARYLDPDPAATNRAVLDDLSNGVSSLWLPAGLDLPRALDGVYLDLVAVVLSDPAQAGDYLRLVADLSPAEVRGNLGADPIGQAARTGIEPDLTGLAAVLELAGPYEQLRPVTVDATVYHDAGGTDADELAISLSVAVAYLRAVGEAAFDQLEFRYAVTANQFASIAKLRAARRLWDRVGELCGVAGRSGQRQHAVTSAVMLTQRDPWVNLLRNTVACFAAAVGGAQAITVTPFDSALGLPDDFGRRLARNTSSILHDESSLARVTDAAGGSFYVETLTDQLAEIAWQKFTELERDGGVVAALASGALAQRLAASWHQRRASLATRTDPVTGVSEFANPAETPLKREPLPRVEPAGLPRHRYAEEFEAFRDRSDALLARTGHRPRVFLAALGPVAAHSGRVGFAVNLFQAGGVEPVIASGNADELVAAFAESGATIACLCSADKVYAEQADEVSDKLAEAGAQVWIAGRTELAQGNIVQSIQLGCDALARLAQVFEGAQS